MVFDVVGLRVMADTLSASEYLKVCSFEFWNHLQLKKKAKCPPTQEQPLPPPPK